MRGNIIWKQWLRAFERHKLSLCHDSPNYFFVNAKGKVLMQ